MDFQAWWGLAQKKYQINALPADIASDFYNARQDQIWKQRPAPAWVTDAIETYHKRIWPITALYQVPLSASQTTAEQASGDKARPRRAPDGGNGIVDVQAKSVSPTSHTTSQLEQTGTETLNLQTTNGEIVAASVSIQSYGTVVLGFAGLPQNVTVYTADGQQDDRLAEGLTVLHYFLSGIETRSADDEADVVQRLVDGLEAVHAIWQAVYTDDLKHPLAALIEGWLNRPTDPDDLDTGILAAPFAASRDMQEAAGASFGLDAHRNTPGAALMDQSRSQAYLPGIQPQTSTLIPALPILLFDHAGLGRRPGRGAPYALRLWVETLLSVPQDARTERQRIGLRFGTLIDWLFPNGGYNAKRDFPALQRAFSIVSNAGIPWGDLNRGGVWSPVRVVNRPIAGNAYNHELILDVDLPPGSTSGPLVYRPILRALSVNSAPGYRAMLGLCYLWDRYGANGGKFIQATRPRFARNAGGQLWNPQGQVRIDKHGNPNDRYMTGKGDTRRLAKDVVALNERNQRVLSIADTERARNPAADKYPVLSTADLVELCYPPIDPTGPTHKLTPSAQRSRRERSVEILKRMETDGYCLVEDLNDGWRILPPEGWGANFSTLG